uniref:Cathepsin propeptide inhibitor domain-containing protein n=1 Tax=Clastoptera arizonana TaxID=38151 RepID=A0A1B6DNN3_9HEMI
MIHFARICFVLLLSNQVLGQYVSDCDNQPLDLTEAKSAIAAAQNVYSQYKSYINNIHQEEEKVKTEFNSYAVGFRKAFDTFNSNAKVKQCVVLAELKSSYDSNVDYGKYHTVTSLPYIGKICIICLDTLYSLDK